MGGIGLRDSGSRVVYGSILVNVIADKHCRCDVLYTSAIIKYLWQVCIITKMTNDD